MLYSAHIFIMLAGTNFFAFLDQSAEISNVSVPTKNSHLKVVLIISVPTCPTNQKKKLDWEFISVQVITHIRVQLGK